MDLGLKKRNNNGWYAIKPNQTKQNLSELGIFYSQYFIEDSGIDNQFIGQHKQNIWQTT